jgi:hypothetical protein
MLWAMPAKGKPNMANVKMYFISIGRSADQGFLFPVSTMDASTKSMVLRPD